MNFKIKILITSFLVTISSFALYPDAKKILFIGNSYTSYNNIPSTVQMLANYSEPKRELIVESYTRISRDLEMIWDAGNVQAIIENGHYDLVILQDSVQGIEFDIMYRYHELYCDLIRKSGSIPAIYMTWDIENQPKYPIEYVIKAYRDISVGLNAGMAPVGIAMKIAEAKKPDIVLRKPDGAHLSQTGSFLAALMLYTFLYGDDPRLNKFYGSIPVDVVSILQ